jgi:hypothetical protein
MAIHDVVMRELEQGLPRLRGTRVVALVPLRQVVLNDILRRLPGAPRDLRLELGADNEVVARYSVFHFTARVHREVQLEPRPTLTLELSSRLVAWGLQQASVPPFVQISGRLIHVDLAGLPGLGDMAGLWRHVARLEFASRAGRLDVLVTVVIE